MPDNSDDLYVVEGAQHVTKRERLPFAVSFAARLADAEEVASATAALYTLGGRTAVTGAVSSTSADEDVVTVTLDLTVAGITAGTSYLLAVSGTIGSRIEDVLVEIVVERV